MKFFTGIINASLDTREVVEKSHEQYDLKVLNGPGLFYVISTSYINTSCIKI